MAFKLQGATVLRFMLFTICQELFWPLTYFNSFSLNWATVFNISIVIIALQMWIQTKVIQQTSRVHMLNKQKKTILHSDSPSESGTFLQVTLQNSSHTWIYLFVCLVLTFSYFICSSIDSTAEWGNTQITTSLFAAIGLNKEYIFLSHRVSEIK